MLSEIEFNLIKELLYKLSGITLGEHKEIMAFNRMKRLTKSINYSGDFTALIKMIDSGKFRNQFINAFTTNKTHFFREKYHFIDFMERVIPEIKTNSIKVLSSACSSGEESYSIAMSFLSAKEKLNNNLNIEIIATDIDTDILNLAKDGKYLIKTHDLDFPEWIKVNNFFDINVDEFIVKSHLKKLISFQELNLMDREYPFKKDEFDVIFCRNVLIYFSLKDQEEILKKLFKHLKIGGTLYIGHSENPIGLNEAIKRVGHNSFIKVSSL